MNLAFPIFVANLIAGLVLLGLIWLAGIVVDRLLQDHLPSIYCSIHGHEWGGAGWMNHTFDPDYVPEDQIMDLWHCHWCHKRLGRLRHYKADYVDLESKWVKNLSNVVML